jgi:hypothetical protein
MTHTRPTRWPPNGLFWPIHLQADVSEQRAAALDRIAKTAAKTSRGEALKLKHAPLSEPQKAKLRERAGAVAAELAAPLPAGDAGLIEAARRLRAKEPQERALYRDFKIDMRTEEEIICGIVDPPARKLQQFIDGVRPIGLAGVAAKLQALLDDDPGIEETIYDGLALLRQTLEFIEREAAR